MKKPASLFFSLILPLLLGGCYYPYEGEVALAQPVYSGYSSFYYDSAWPGYSYSPFYYNHVRWSRPAYVHPPRQWRPAPGYRSHWPPLRPGWQNRPGKPHGFRPGGPSWRPNNPGFNPDFRSPAGDPPRPSLPASPMPREHRW